MKKSIIAGIFFFTSLFNSLPCAAQKTTQSSLGSFSFTGYPTLPIPLGYKLYALVDDAGMSHPYGKPVCNSIALANRTKVKSAESAELIIRITQIYEHQSELFFDTNPHLHTIKAKQNKEISFDVTIEDTAGVFFLDNFRKGKEFASDWEKDAAKAERSVRLQTQNFNLTNELRRYNTLLNTKLGANNLTAIYLHVYGAKNKRKGTADYDSLALAAKEYKQAVSIIKADEFDAEKFRERVRECVVTWERELDNYRIGDERITEEIAAGLHYNLATYYIFTRNYDDALDELELSEKTHKGFSNAKELYTTVRTWRNMKRNYDKLIEESSLGK